MVTRNDHVQQHNVIVLFYSFCLLQQSTLMVYATDIPNILSLCVTLECYASAKLLNLLSIEQFYRFIYYFHHVIRVAERYARAL